MTTETKTPIQTKSKAAQATNGGVAMALAVVAAWGVAQAGVEVPAEITAAVATIIGWAFARFG